MGRLKHVGDPTHTISPAVSELVDRLGEVVRDDPSDTWTCTVDDGAHGFSVRIRHAPPEGHRAGRRGPLVYECDGSADAIVKDFRSWLGEQPLAG
jgi:hypothetical protein